MNEIKLLESASLINRNIRNSKQIREQQRGDRLQEQTATILGYQAITGQFRVKDNSEKIFYARAITNSGELSLGAIVSLVIPAGGIPIIDAMPR